MKLIVGLGNPGERYEKTRHNLGFMVIEQFLKDYEPVRKTLWENSNRYKSDIVELEWKPKVGPLEKVVLAKPKTFMNNSGMAVQLLTTYYKLRTTDIWIIHDDIDLPLGSIRIRKGGSSGGHRGIDSIMQQLGSEKFWRFRLGIGHPYKNTDNKDQHHKSYVRDVDDFVLKQFTASERGKVKELIKRASKAVQMGLEDGLEAAMNKFNTK